MLEYEKKMEIILSDLNIELQKKKIQHMNFFIYDYIPIYVSFSLFC